MAETTDEYLHRVVLGTVHDLEAAASGTLYKTENSDYLIIDDLDEWKEKQYKKKAEKFRKEHPERDFNDCADDPFEEYDSYEEYMEDEIGTADDIEEPEQVSLSEYIDNESLGDTVFEVNQSKEFQGARTLVACGGPTIWITDESVRGYWSSERIEMPLDSATAGELYAIFEEQWSQIICM